MSKKKYIKGIESLNKQIDTHQNIKLVKAIEEGNTELAGYYRKEIERFKEQIQEKQTRLLPRSKRIKAKNK